MNKLALTLMVLSVSGCATHDELLALPKDELCYRALTGDGFTPKSRFWEVVSAREIDCSPYRAGAQALVESRQQGMANGMATLNAMQQQKLQQQQLYLQQQQQQAPVRIQPLNCYPNNQPYGPAFICR